MIKEFKNEYRWLSNFAPVEIVLEGITYPSVENAYMSAKSPERAWKKFCSDPDSKPWEVKKRSRNLVIRKDWESVKLSIMEECLIQKFSKKPYKEMLIATGEMYIQEGNFWNDKFWGFCLKTNTGQNNLGKLIMKIRDDLSGKNNRH